MRSRGLPDDHAGPIRIVDIEGIDANMCCGTHVSNLSHLQVQLHTLMQTHKHLDVKVYIHVIFVRLGVPQVTLKNCSLHASFLFI